MSSLIDSDYRKDEFYSFRYTSRFEKGDVVHIRVGDDLEAARFQARKSFPEVLNEYWWLKPSDATGLKNLALHVKDILYYHGGIPTIVMVSANNLLVRKAQIFVKRRDEAPNRLEASQQEVIETAEPKQLLPLLHHHNLLVRIASAVKINDNRSAYNFNSEDLIAYSILTGELDNLIPLGEEAVPFLLERFFVSAQAKEIARIIDTIIAIGEVALPLLDDQLHYLSLLASPFYSKRLKWTKDQIEKKL